MITPITFPSLTLRLVKGSPLTWSEGDDNLTAIQNFCTQLQTLLIGIVGTSLNQDGTLTPSSVNSSAIQNAAVTLAALNPSLLYSVIPVDTDIGTTTNQYAITARGGYGGSNIVPGGAQYDANGNYTLTGLVPNYAYYWTKGNNDISCQSNPSLTASGSFTAYATTVILTGTPNSTVQATVVQSAPINAYKNGQMFFVYTTRSNTGAVTLNVNNLGAIPVKMNGSDIPSGIIVGPTVFAVVYQNGVFVLFSGGNTGSSSGSNSNTTVITTTGMSGTQIFNIPATSLATSGFPVQNKFAHGLGAVPATFMPSLQCLTAENGFAIGQQVSLSQFVLSSGSPAFTWEYDNQYLYITQLGAPYVIDPATGGSAVAITAANWSLVAMASSITSYAGVAVFPALEYQMAYPGGGFSYGTNLYTFKIQNTGGSNMLVNQINLLNNEVVPVAQVAYPENSTVVNGAIFPGSFSISGSTPVFLYTSDMGIFYFPVTNPGTNAFTGGLTYGSTSGTGSFTGYGSVTQNSLTGAYIWTPASNDYAIVASVSNNQYFANDAVNGQLLINESGSYSATLWGVEGTAVGGTLISTSSSWSPTQLNNNGGLNARFKPVWHGTNSTPSVATYLVGSNPNSGDTISSLACYEIIDSGGKSTPNQFTYGGNTGNATNLDLTDANSYGIQNVAAFNKFYPAGSSAAIRLFQYNPLTQRIYVITTGMDMVHIFQLTTSSNDFAAWWANSAGSSGLQTRAQKLKYIKSLAIAGATHVQANWDFCNYTVEYNLSTGKEVCIVATWGGSNNEGVIQRIPWVE